MRSTHIFQLSAKQALALGFLLSFICASISLQASNPAANDSLEINRGEEELAIESKRGWYSTSLYAEFGMPKINHNEAGLDYDNTFSYGGGINLNFRFVKWLGLQVGAGLSFQNNNISLESYEAEFDAVDSEGDAYTEIITARDVKEEQTWLFLNIPLALSYYRELGKIELYGFGGVELRHALKADYNQNGTFGHQGYYEQWNILFDDLPALGFYTDRLMEVEAKMEADLLTLPFVGIGMFAPGQKGRFYLEARYYFKSNDPFADEKYPSLFPGPENNQAIGSYKNPSVMNYGDVSFEGIKFVLGINF